MAVHVYRCGACGREVLVRLPGENGSLLSEAEIERMIEEETRPRRLGPEARMGSTLDLRLRDDIWVGISGLRPYVPRHEVPEECPACRRRGTLAHHRPLEE